MWEWVWMRESLLALAEVGADAGAIDGVEAGAGLSMATSTDMMAMTEKNEEAKTRKGGRADHE